ncbi:MAG: LptF/LptG family permease [Cyclobacteriaceae bacterium]|nr:LptF/LptG family permease [Cyclobacteriaceae bacterium]
MKRIDKLVLGNFLGPFILTFLVVIFILLSQFMLRYIDEIVGKDLDSTVIMRLIFYFSLFMTPNAFPLAVLLSSLMTFGNLGQHFELTAMKSAGISLIRVLMPIFAFALILTAVAYYSNNNIVPKANLEAFSLLYDVKQKKPSMELKEGAFYNGIENYSIKVGEKLPDGKTLKDLIIYDHSLGLGNKQITMADSGMMYNILNDRYLVLELFNGKTYREDKSNNAAGITTKYPDPLLRNEFKSQKVVFSLASFDLKETRKELFAGNRLMKNEQQLKSDVDSMSIEYVDKREEVKEQSFQFFDYHLHDLLSVYKQHALERQEKKRLEELAKEEKLRLEEAIEKGDTAALARITESTDTLESNPPPLANTTSVAIPEIRMDTSVRSRLLRKRGDFPKIQQNDTIRSKAKIALAYDSVEVVKDTTIRQRTAEETYAMLDSAMNTPEMNKLAISKCLTHVRYVKNNMEMRNSQLITLKGEINKFALEQYKKLSYACTILIMFLIGAPLGSIIKRGGLGLPVLISISFYILFYVVSMISEKYTRTDRMDPMLAAWMANLILMPIGLFFMRQARNDARLFDFDFYSVALMQLKSRLFKKNLN